MEIVSVEPALLEFVLEKPLTPIVLSLENVLMDSTVELLEPVLLKLLLEEYAAKSILNNVLLDTFVEEEMSVFLISPKLLV
jgi:hypothetical protein